MKGTCFQWFKWYFHWFIFQLWAACTSTVWWPKKIFLKPVANSKHLFLGARLTCHSQSRQYTSWSCSWKKEAPGSCWSRQLRPLSASLTSVNSWGPERTRGNTEAICTCCNPLPQGQGWLDKVVNNLRGVAGIYLQKLSDRRISRRQGRQIPSRSSRKHLGYPEGI